jgi:hypothetical protein
MNEIKVNSRGQSRLLLTYPIDLRMRAKAMALALGQSEQSIIRRGIDLIVGEWERAQPAKPVKKTRGRRKAGAK